MPRAQLSDLLHKQVQGSGAGCVKGCRHGMLQQHMQEQGRSFTLAVGALRP